MVNFEKVIADWKDNDIALMTLMFKFLKDHLQHLVTIFLNELLFRNLDSSEVDYRNVFSVITCHKKER